MVVAIGPRKLINLSTWRSLRSPMLLIDAPSSAHLSAPRKEHAMDGTRYATRAVVCRSMDIVAGWGGRIVVMLAVAL